MIKIGKFAKLCGVDTQTLRYYDKIGVLCADYVDESNGYRYYDEGKLQAFRTILHLKDLNFSLEEIKHFLSVSSEEQTALYSQKRHMLQRSIEADEEKLRQIDAFCISDKKPIASFLDVPFEDDPRMIGKWVLCGALDKDAVFTGEANLKPAQTLLETIYFLPGGGYVWNYFWSKGILWRLLGSGSCIPQRYHVFSFKRKLYLSLAPFEGKGVENELHIYRQADTNIYTEEQACTYKDNIDLPFVADPLVLGTWQTVDLIEHPSRFTANPVPKDNSHFFIREITFFERGVCYKIYQNAGHTPRRICAYTAGGVLDREMRFAERYELRRENGEDYLILEHKNGDYACLGKIFCYYVFKLQKKPLKKEKPL